MRTLPKNKHKLDSFLGELSNDCPPAIITITETKLNNANAKSQRWSSRGRPWPRGRPRGHILKFLALASRPQVLENCPVLGLRNNIAACSKPPSRDNYGKVSYPKTQQRDQSAG